MNIPWLAIGVLNVAIVPILVYFLRARAALEIGFLVVGLAIIVVSVLVL